MSSNKNKKAEKQTLLPNIQYCGRKQKLNAETGKTEWIEKEVPPFVVNAGQKILLPAGIEKGVYVEPETAQKLFALMPKDFKTPVFKRRQSSKRGKS